MRIELYQPLSAHSEVDGHDAAVVGEHKVAQSNVAMGDFIVMQVLDAKRHPVSNAIQYVQG